MEKLRFFSVNCGFYITEILEGILPKRIIFFTSYDFILEALFSAASSRIGIPPILTRLKADVRQSRSESVFESGEKSSPQKAVEKP